MSFSKSGAALVIPELFIVNVLVSSGMGFVMSHLH